MTNYTLLSNKQSCVCKLFGIDGRTCVQQCGSNTTRVSVENDPDAQQCACQSGFSPAEDGSSCVCAGYLDLLGESCVSACGQYQFPTHLIG